MKPIPPEIWGLVVEFERDARPWACPALRLACRACNVAVCRTAPRTAAGRAWIFALLVGQLRPGERGPRALPPWIPTDDAWVRQVCGAHLPPKMPYGAMLGALQWDVPTLGRLVATTMLPVSDCAFRWSLGTVPWHADCARHMVEHRLRRTLACLPWAELEPMNRLGLWLWARECGSDCCDLVERGWGDDETGIRAFLAHGTPIPDVDRCLEAISGLTDPACLCDVLVLFAACRRRVALASGSLWNETARRVGACVLGLVRSGDDDDVECAPL